MQFEPYTYIQTKVRERKLKFFSRGITLSKNHPTMAKFKLDLHNPTMYPYTKFKLNVCNHLRDNGRKPIYGMTKDNTICPWPIHGGGIKTCQYFHSYFPLEQRWITSNPIEQK
jgi:hypothetical protein